MTLQNFKQRLRQGDLLLGLGACMVRSVDIVAVTRSAGFDWILIDAEHSPYDSGVISTLAVAAHLAGLPALVRVTGSHSHELARVLDAGAAGVIVPHVDSADEAAAVARACRFPPVGMRSVPTPLPQFGFRGMPPTRLMAAVEEEIVVSVMIESRGGLTDAEKIAAVDGIDAVIVGVNDLSVDLGAPGEIASPVVSEAIAAVAAAARRAGKAFGVMGLPQDLLERHARANGATLVVATNDLNLLADAACNCARQYRGLLTDDRAG